MSVKTMYEAVSYDIYKKSWRETCRSFVFDVDIVQCALIVASFITRLIDLNTPSAVV